jgi:hypothetical protein
MVSIKRMSRAILFGLLVGCIIQIVLIGRLSSSFSSEQLHRRDLYYDTFGRPARIQDGTKSSMVFLARQFYKKLATIGGSEWTNIARVIRNATNRVNNLDNDTLLLINRTGQLAADMLVNALDRVPYYEPPTIHINCSDPIYSKALTGELDPADKMIIDLSPFGWDVEFLEIRLLEYSDLIHSLVVPEQNYNHKGLPKPMLVPRLLQGRLAAFRDKIDYLPQDVSSLIPELITNELIIDNAAMRGWTLDYIKEKYSHLDASKIFIIQNDGDELITRKAMAHFKSCQLRYPMNPQRFPALMFKRNTAWLQKLPEPEYRYYNLRKFTVPGLEHESEKLSKYLWLVGPVIQSLDFADGYRDYFRKQPDGGTMEFSSHFGVGCANHFSNPSQPILEFLKTFSTVDAWFETSPDFWKQAELGNMSYMDSRKEFFLCNGMDSNWQWKPVATTFDNKTVQFIVDSLPWAVRTIPNRYAWLYHDNLFQEEIMLYQCLCQKRNCDKIKQ